MQHIDLRGEGIDGAGSKLQLETSRKTHAIGGTPTIVSHSIDRHGNFGVSGENCSATAPAANKANDSLRTGKVVRWSLSPSLLMRRWSRWGRGRGIFNNGSYPQKVRVCCR